ncbi:MAG: hypothetical protein HN757_18045 [Calditrichaeota bacterium]|jgi:hypothetical protein|nr:hypothetical protein [Calditrichota bacterium]
MHSTKELSTSLFIRLAFVVLFMVVTFEGSRINCYISEAWGARIPGKETII